MEFSLIFNGKMQCFIITKWEKVENLTNNITHKFKCFQQHWRLNNRNPTNDPRETEGKRSSPAKLFFITLWDQLVGRDITQLLCFFFMLFSSVTLQVVKP